ncbi:MAG TPA: sulfur carrier protein ThiS, partial [Anaerolineales bacterium]|nr:sulfur carrier protein ThiS [Anaerolineales bacterium]
MNVYVNGELREVSGSPSLAELVAQLELPASRIAIELNREVVRRGDWGSTMLKDEDRIEIVHFVGGGNVSDEKLVIGGRAFTSRLIIGTGKYRSYE